MNTFLARALLGCGLLAVVLTDQADAQNLYSVPADRTESIHRYDVPPGDWLGTQENDALQTIIIYDNMFGFEHYEVRRSFLEFTIPDLAGSVTASLVLKKYYEVGGDRRILVSVYDPQTEITLDTFYTDVIPFDLLTTDGSVQEETVTLDISLIVDVYRGRKLGLRLSVNDESPGSAEHFFFGIGIDDGYLGTPPRIDITETELDPETAIADLLLETAQIHSPKGVIDSLSVKVKGAQEAWKARYPGAVKTATNKMHAFIHEVGAQRGKKILVLEADMLKIKAMEVIALMEKPVPGP